MRGHEAWNHVIWDAISELKFIFEAKPTDDYFIIDKIFVRCEKKLRQLGAPEKEIKLRLFALAVHCDKSYPKEFFHSIVFARYSLVLDFSYFEQISKTLIEENNLALVVFFTVLKCSIANYLPRKDYISLEGEMKRALLAS